MVRPAVEQLHDELFFRPSRYPDPQSALAVLEHLAGLSALAELRVLVVGSLLYAPSSSRDIDILLTGGAVSSIEPSPGAVERALIACAAAGLDVAGVRVDPTYRPRGSERRLAGPLSPDVPLLTWRLEDPGRTFRRAAGLEVAGREVGAVSFIEETTAGQCAFYRKLPPHPRLRNCRFLTPAVPIERFIARLERDHGKWPQTGAPSAR